ncbi:hypothetical protein [Parasphingorhabdus cellanae]|uniref:Terminase small subunit n=1 Tax=Parasphingorhabdus cellanae TaxID=2806553 RepID=A0ABX7T9D0_9SPHN|nr:hypothetical protein [Parasphingorhabdus cellanae]QTD56940.1 hypothetical protein J4G78_05055 [Parasphingorhabdus cellanae]
MGFQDDFARNAKKQRRSGNNSGELAGQEPDQHPFAAPAPDGERETLHLRYGDDGGAGDNESVEASNEPNDAPRAKPARATRHDGWTPEIRVKFLEALANCGHVGSAAIFVERSRTSAYSLRRRNIDFSRAWDAALLIGRDVSTDALQDRAVNGIEEEVYYQGEVVGTKRRYDNRLLLAHIARLDRMAERISVSRGAARFDEMLDAIATETDTSPLISEPTTDEIVDIIAETEAQATVQEVEAECLRQSNSKHDDKLSAEAEADPESAAARTRDPYYSDAPEKEKIYGPMHEVDWGDGKDVEYWRMFAEEAAEITAKHPQVKTREVAMDDPAFLSTIMASSAVSLAADDIEADRK